MSDRWIQTLPGQIQGHPCKGSITVRQGTKSIKSTYLSSSLLLCLHKVGGHGRIFHFWHSLAAHSVPGPLSLSSIVIPSVVPFHGWSPSDTLYFDLPLILSQHSPDLFSSYVYTISSSYVYSLNHSPAVIHLTKLLCTPMPWCSSLKFVTMTS